MFMIWIERVPPSLSEGDSVRLKVTGTILWLGGQSVVGDAVTFRSPPQPMVLLPKLWSASEAAAGAAGAEDDRPLAVATREARELVACVALSAVLPATALAARAAAALVAPPEAEVAPEPAAPIGAPRVIAPRAQTLTANIPRLIRMLTSQAVPVDR